MAYRMHEVSDSVRVGFNSRGEAHIEVWDRSDNSDAAEILIPSQDVEDLATWLLKHAR